MWKSLLLFISLLSFFLSRAQSLDQTLAFAQQKLSEKNYYEAIDASRRVTFFDKGDNLSHAYTLIAESYFHLNEYSEAIKYYDMAYHLLPNDSLKIENTFKKTYCLVLTKNNHSALAELFNLPDSLSLQNSKSLEFLYGAVYFQLNDFNESEKYFLSYFKQEEQKQLEIKELFEENKSTNKISPKKARILSMIIPGLGQFYLGDIKNGLNSLLLTGGLLFLGVNTMITYSFIEGSIAVLPWLHRYYMGGFKRAELLANKKIEKKRNATYKEILEVVEREKN